MSANRSTRIVIIVLGVVLGLLIGGGLFMARNAFAPPEATIDPTAEIVLPTTEGTIGRTAPLEIHFDQKMNQESVLAALTILPPVEYSATWSVAGAGETVTLTPKTPLAWDTTYSVTLGNTAHNNRGRALAQPITVTFGTARQVNIISVFPTDGTEDVAPTEAITVQFDQPIVDLATVEDTNGGLQPVVIEPAVVGSGQWIAADTYAFFPSAGLTSGTDYSVRVQSQIAPTLELESPYRWQFNTAGPRLTASYPFDGAGEVERATAITLLFDQPMDRDSVEENFLLSTGGEEVDIAGEFVWTDDRTLSFRPAEALQVATSYTVTVDADVVASGGMHGLAAPYRAVFTTVDFLAVESVQPAPGSTEVTIAPTDTVIAVQFNHPVVPILGLSEKENLPSPITIAPRLAGEGEWVTTSLFVFRPTESLQPSTEYRITVPQGTQDTLGAYLQEAYSWSFTTEYPRVLRLEPTNENNLISPTGPIGLRFNQPMNPASTEAAFTLIVTDNPPPIEGNFEWEDGNSLLNFYPLEPLPRNAELTITVAEGAAGALGGKTFEPYTATVKTPPFPGIRSTDPRNGATNAPRYGGITLFFASPMDPEVVEEYVTFSPQATEFYTNYEPSSFAFNFYPRNFSFASAETTFTVTVDGDLPDATGQTIGEDYVFSYTTEPAPAILQLASDYGRIGTYNPFTETVQLVRHRNLETLDFSLYRLTERDLLQAMGGQGYEFIDDFTGSPDSVVAQWTVDVEKANNITPLRTLIPPDSDIPRTGAYLLRASTPDQVLYQGGISSPVSNLVMIYTPLNLTIKRAPTEVLVWATDIRTGEPVANAPISLYTSGSRLITEGSTDENGLYRYDAESVDELGYPYERVNALSVNETGDLLGATSTAFTADLYGGLWNIEQNLTPEQLYGTIYSERPIYRPGHTVYFKGIVRRLDGMDFQVPELTRSMTLTVNNYDGEVYTTEVTLSEYGTFEGQFTLDEDAITGYYNFTLNQSEIQVCYGSNSCYYPYLTGQFQVAEYVRPEFEVVVTPGAETFIEGNPLTATVGANYYFGGVVADANYVYRLLARRHYFTSPYVPGYWTWGDYDSYLPIRGYFGDYDSATVVESGSGQLNRDGTAEISIPTGLTVQPNQPSASQELLIEADVADVNDRSVSGRSKVILHAGAFYIGLNGEEYFGVQGQPFTVNIATAATTGELLGDQSVNLELYERVYNTERQENSDGSATYVTTFTDTLESTLDVTTNVEGYATATFEPQEGGSYTLLALGEDAQGNEIRSRFYFWVSDGDFIPWGDSAENAIQLRSDQLIYRAGDTAEILVPAPYEGMTALITLEQNGIIQNEVRVLASTAEVIEVPITEEMIPNVFLSVALVRGADAGDGIPEFRMGVVNLQVEPREKTLDVALIPQVEDVNTTFEPGEEATYTLQVTNKAGEPIQAEVSLAVVDKATLALAQEKAPELLSVFYRLRPLSVVTASDLTVNINRLIRALDPIVEGGGGGGGGGGGQGNLSVREELVDTAYWQADIRTDENGQAEISFTLPDNLTTWVLTARAVTEDDTLVGETIGELLSTKPVLIRPTLPRFLVRGDQFFVRLVANNNTDEPLEATIGYSEEGLSQTDDSGTSKEVTLPARGQAVVEFPVTVDNVNEVNLIAEVSAGVYNDRVAYTMPVYYLTAPETVGTGGVVRPGEGGTVETIRVPQGAEPNQGELTVEVAPSLAGATRNSLELFYAYEWDSVEARTSALLPNLATLRAMRVMEITNIPGLEGDLEDEIAMDVTFLSNAQNRDGGWGWWPETTPSNPWLSAYAYMALRNAKANEFEVSDDVLETGATYLTGYLQRTRLRQDNAILDTRAFMLYVLSEGNQANPNDIQTLFDQRTFLNPDGKAFLLMALDNGVGNRAQVQTLAAELTGSARLSATGAFWEEPTPDYFALDSTLRTTSVVLRALVRVEPEYALLPQTVRWLMHARQGEWWEGTHTTAWAIWALTDFMEATGELEGNFAYEIALNDEIVLSEQVTEENITDPISLTIAMPELVLEGDNRLIVTPQPPSNREMQGRLYYQAWLNYALPLADSPARFEGIQVSRTYERADPITFTTTGAEVSEVQPGDVVLVRVTLNAPNDLTFLTLEDPIPAGFEIVDQSLATNSQAADAPDVERTDPNRGVYWYDGWSQTVIRDEKVALFAEVLPRGTYEYTYLIRAVVPGEFGVLPTYAYQMYHPEVFGRGEGTIFTIAE